MKKLFLLSLLILIHTGCNDGTIPKPDKLIEKGVMVNILYDLSLLEAAKSRNPYSTQNQSINPKEFIYKKYAVDSAQFAQSNQYYVSQIGDYKRMYEEVGRKLEAAKKENESKFRASHGNPAPVTSNADAPQIQ